MAGVASGIARHLDLDPVLVRLAFVIVTLAGGAGVLAYLVGWLVIPEAAPGDEATTTPPATSAAADRAPAVRLVVGAVLVLVGTSWFVDQVVPGVGRVTWPLTLIALGLFVIAAGARR